MWYSRLGRVFAVHFSHPTTQGKTLGQTLWPMQNATHGDMRSLFSRFFLVLRLYHLVLLVCSQQLKIARDSCRLLRLQLDSNDAVWVELCKGLLIHLQLVRGAMVFLWLFLNPTPNTTNNPNEQALEHGADDDKRSLALMLRSFLKLQGPS